MNLAKQLEKLKKESPGNGESNLERGLVHIGYIPYDGLISGENYSLPFDSIRIGLTIQDLDSKKGSYITLSEFQERSDLRNIFLLSIFGNKDFLEQLWELKSKLSESNERNGLNFMLFEGYKLERIVTWGYVIKSLVNEEIPLENIQRSLKYFERNQNGIYVYNGMWIGNSYNFNLNE